MSTSNIQVIKKDPEKSTYEHVYDLNYFWTKKIWNSNDLISKIIRKSILGIIFLAATETIIELVKIPFRAIKTYYFELSLKLAIFKILNNKIRVIS